MAKSRGGSGAPSAAGSTPATRAIAASGASFRVHQYAHDPRAESFGTEAAEALGVGPDLVFKTLIAQVDGTLTVAIVPVAGTLDLKALALALGAKKAELAPLDLAERKTGYLVGGISPIGQRARLQTVIDESARRHGTVFVSGGKRGLEIELAPEDLVSLTGALWAAIARRR